MLNLSNNEIRRLLAPYSVAASDHLCEQIRAYSNLLLRWNQKIALTTVTDPSEIIRFHFGESLFALSVVSSLAGALADIGSGAGFPGLALKLASPETHVTLIEPNVKKSTFLSEAVRSLGLETTFVFRGRMEDLPSDRGPFEFMSVRALGSHFKILDLASRRLNGGGKVLLWLNAEDARSISERPGWNWHRPALIPGTKGRYILVGEALRSD
ncbi:MAG TPA: 16S rRNA (guanine(527)-N(7))-methyltransferase RsmG [Candidatus Acidoferrum sp.]|nr:16S rRNA (guanine(527)-N(7))-methyltransferase RsmG [Candidatus Acidoferrum sp.]